MQRKQLSIPTSCLATDQWGVLKRKRSNQKSWPEKKYALILQWEEKNGKKCPPSPRGEGSLSTAAAQLPPGLPAAPAAVLGFIL